MAKFKAAAFSRARQSKNLVILAFMVLSLVTGYDASWSPSDVKNSNNQLKRSNFHHHFKQRHESHPVILTKFTRVTAFERSTIVLPCVILNLPAEMHVIWQYGKRGEINQTVLSVGGTQVESNYRLRVISNSSSIDDDETVEYLEQQMHQSAGSSARSTRVTVNNLEIRRLQLSDSGWYECQLPTKPTQINYIHLEVLGMPKIEPTSRNAQEGEEFELMCKVRNLPPRFELTWYFNDRKMQPTEISTELEKQARDKRATEEEKQQQLSKKMKNPSETSEVNLERPKGRGGVVFQQPAESVNISPTFTAVVDLVHNVTMSRLKINSLDWYHKGLYKCKYDQAEAFYNLDFESNPKSRNHGYDMLLSLNAGHQLPRIKLYEPALVAALLLVSFIV